MSENFELKLAQQIAEIKASFLRRSVPEAYEPLIRERLFMVSPQSFSRYLATAVSVDGLPDCSRSENRDGIEKKLQSEFLTEFGAMMKALVKGRNFIDCGSGSPDGSPIVPLVAKAFEAKRYIGIDIELAQDKIHTIHSFEAVHFKDDVLRFVSQLERDENGFVFYVSGFEPIEKIDSARRQEVEEHNPYRAEKDRKAQEYIDACLREISRVTQNGDAVIIGQGTHGFDPSLYGFKLKAEIGYHKLYEKV